MRNPKEPAGFRFQGIANIPVSSGAAPSCFLNVARIWQSEPSTADAMRIPEDQKTKFSLVCVNLHLFLTLLKKVILAQSHREHGGKLRYALKFLRKSCQTVNFFE